MPIVRELITLLGTQVDTTGFQQYEKGISRLKDLAIAAGKVIGVAFTVDKVIEFADGLVTAGKEINKLSAQLKVIARPFDDMAAAQDQVFETAQRLGIEYTSVLDTFKEFQNEMRETNIPAEDVVAATENIYKSLQVSRVGAEGMAEAMELFNRSFQRGSFRSIGIGRLGDISPKTLDVLAESFNKFRQAGETNEDMLRRLAKAGKVTAEAVVTAFAQANQKLEEDWNKVPQKLDKAFIRIKNDLIDVTARIYKMTDASVFMGRVVWGVWSTLRSGVKWFVDALGGLENTIRLIGITLAVVFGPKLLAMIAMATAATIRWAIANWAAVAPWIAMAAAVAAVAIAIEDIVGWVQGRRSLIGTWVGSFKDLKENFANLDIFAGFRSIKDLFSGDFEAFKKDFKILMNDLSAEVLALTALVGAVFASWKVIQFAQLLTGLGKVKTAVAEVGAAADVSAAKVSGKDKTTGAGPTVDVDTDGKPKPTGKTDMPGPRNPAGRGMLFGINAINPFMMALEDYNRRMAGEPALPKPLDDLMENTDLGRRIEAGWQSIQEKIRNTIAEQWKNLKPGEAGPTGREMVQPQPVIRAPTDLRRYDDGGIDDATGLPRVVVRPIWDLTNPVGTSALPGSVAPGAMAPVVPGPINQTVAPVFNQSVGGITVNSVLDADQIARAVNTRLGALAQDNFNAFARDVQVAAPRVEAATQ